MFPLPGLMSVIVFLTSPGQIFWDFVEKEELNSSPV